MNIIRNPVSVSKFGGLLKEGSWILLGQVLTVAGTLGLVRFLTEHLTPAQYGTYALALTVASLVNQLATGGVNNAVGRFYSVAVEKCELGIFLRESLKLLGSASVCVALVGGALGFYFHDRVSVMLIGFLMVFSILSGYISAFSSIQNAARQRAIAALCAAFETWLRVGMCAVVFKFFGADGGTTVAGYMLAAIFALLCQIFFLKKLLRSRLDNSAEAAPRDLAVQWRKELLIFAWPFTAWGAFTWAQQASDRWALEIFADSYAVGHYAVVFQLGYTSISTVNGLIMSLASPILFQRSGAATDPERNAQVDRTVWKMACVTLVVTSLGILLASLLHAEVFKVVVAEPFRAASYLLPWTIAAGGMFAAGQLLTIKHVADINPRVMLPVKIVTAIAGLALNFIGAWMGGVGGVVYAGVCFSSLYLGWMIYLSREIGPKQWNSGDVN